MGINNFFPFVKKTYSEAIKDEWLDSYDNILFDLNHLLHNVCYSSKTTYDIKTKLTAHLNDILLKTRPKKLVYVATDGQPAFGKLFLQRERRYRHVKTLQTSKSKNTKISDKLTGDTIKLHFTPRTVFMHEVLEVLKDFGNYVRLVHNIKFEIDVLGNGEGELKVRNRMNSLDMNETSLVYSGDTDMIPILMSIKDVSNVYQAYGKDKIIHIGKVFEIHKNTFNPTSSLDDDTIKSDMVFLNCMMGNDYLPKVKYLMLEKVWDAYGKVSSYYNKGLVCSNMTDEGTIYTYNYSFISDVITTALSDSRYKNSYNNMNYTTNINNYNTYMKGVLWCHDTYMRGYCNDYQYTYSNVNNYIDNNSKQQPFVPHFDGVLMFTLTNEEFLIPKRDAIDPDLYSVLIIPSIASDFGILTEKQKTICDMVSEKFSIVHEREKCKKCTNMCISIDKIKKNKDDKYKDLINKYKKHLLTHNVLTGEEVVEINNYICNHNN